MAETRRKIRRDAERDPDAALNQFLDENVDYYQYTGLGFFRNSGMSSTEKFMFDRERLRVDFRKKFR